MITWVLYDIKEDRARSKASKFCKQAGLYRVQYSTFLGNLDAQQRNIALAETVYQTTKKKFEQGLGSSFEVLQSDADLQTAQSNYFTALYNAIIARIGYQSSLGRLE